MPGGSGPNPQGPDVDPTVDPVVDPVVDPMVLSPKRLGSMKRRIEGV
jgi:hypothetical protein